MICDKRKKELIAVAAMDTPFFGQAFDDLVGEEKGFVIELLAAANEVLQQE